MEKINFENSVARRIMVSDDCLSFIDQFRPVNNEEDPLCLGNVNIKGRKEKEEDICIGKALSIIDNTKVKTLDINQFSQKIFKIARPGKYLGFDRVIIESSMTNYSDLINSISTLISSFAKNECDNGFVDVEFGLFPRPNQMSKGVSDLLNIRLMNTIHGFSTDIPVMIIDNNFIIPEHFVIETTSADDIFKNQILSEIFLFDREIEVIKFTDDFYILYDLYLCVDEESTKTDRENALLKLQKINPDCDITIIGFEHTNLPNNGYCWLKYNKLG